jgi:hypothetical protein
VRPSVGHIVHYVSYGTPGGEYKSECRVAIITEVPPAPGPSLLSVGEVEYMGPNNLVGLCVLNPSGIFFNDCEQDEDDKRGGTWHWPERRAEHRPSEVTINVQPPKPEIRFVPVPLEPGHRI